MNYQCFEVISMQGPDSKLGSQPLSLQTHERAISDAGSCCNLSSCAVLGNMSVHLNPVSAGNARRKRWLQGEHRRICLCVFINPWGAEHVWNLLFFPFLSRSAAMQLCANIQAHVAANLLSTEERQFLMMSPGYIPCSTTHSASASRWCDPARCCCSHLGV